MSPIKDKSAYPKDWKEIVDKISQRSGGRCECSGQCGLHHQYRCREQNGLPAVYARGRIILTTAHLCHEAHCSDVKHMIHACQRCHLRIDRDEHRRNSSHTRAEKKAGKTLELFK